MSESKLRTTDIANGIRFRELMRDRVLYDPDTDIWFLWDTRRWMRVSGRSDARVRELAKEVVFTIDDEVAREQNESIRDSLRDWAKQSQSSARISAMLSAAKAERELWVSASEFDTIPYLLNATNGTVDLRTSTLSPADPKQKITRLVPYPYEPQEKAPRFEALLNRMVACDATGRTGAFMRKAIGYSMLGRNPEQVAFLIEGETNTGKSQVLETVAAVLGSEYATSTIKPEVIAKSQYGPHTTALDKLAGKHFTAITEAAQGLDVDEYAIKSLTGSGSASMRALWSNERDVPVTWTLFVAVNEDSVNIERWEPAIARRLIVIKSGPTVPVEERILGLKEHIVENEARGVLAVLIRGAREYHQDLAAMSKVFTLEHVPAAVRNAMLEAERRYDHVAAFVRDWCEFDENAYTPTSDVSAKYHSLRPNAPKKGPGTLSSQALFRRIESVAKGMGHGNVRRDGRYLVGLRLRESSLSDHFNLAYGV
ncbi:hypothetical protein I6E74_06245 [Salinibacterium sp. SWN139]|uniref:DNA primase family protein n=1 Tax=Salinibacterium sp. SWN139 TaxID=2792055 RepID=UPI0018CDC4CB|nr:phage/plasmid primase, P4 family [Salinibacterium sp. SWN139]MBH0053771.1 hypothetical protein [Salinibacterium sp. SWN139]